MDSLEHRMDSMEHRMDSMEHRMDSMEHRMDSMEHRMDSMGRELCKTNENLHSLEADMKDGFFNLNMRLENEVFFAIKAVADGHADIMRKYRNLLDERYDKEQIIVKLVHHDMKFNEFERKCSKCA